MEPVITPRRTQRDGIEFTFCGFTPDENGDESEAEFEINLIVPPLNFTALQQLGSKLFGDVGTQTEQMQTVITALNLSLKRNYKGVPVWLISQSVDFGNMGRMFEALMDVSHIHRKAVEDEKKARAASLSGTTSMPISSPAPDTPGTK